MDDEGDVGGGVVGGAWLGADGAADEFGECFCLELGAAWGAVFGVCCFEFAVMCDSAFGFCEECCADGCCCVGYEVAVEVKFAGEAV